MSNVAGFVANGAEVPAEMPTMGPSELPPTPRQIPGPGPGTLGPAPGGAAVPATTSGSWWMDPKILALGAAALFILMRKK